VRQKDALFAQFNEWGFDEKGWTPHTRNRYTHRIRAAEEWLTKNRKVSVLFADTKDLKAYLFSTTPSARNRNNIRQALVAWCEFLIDQGIGKANPALGLKRLPEPDSFPKAISPKEAHRVEVAARHHGPMVEALILVMLYGGLRRDEARLLQWGHLDDGWLRFQGKGNKTRAVPVAKVLGRALDRWKAKSLEPVWVFPSPKFPERPMSESYLRTLVLAVAETAGVDLHPHKLRHTAATRLLETGADMRTVQEYLGHSSASTTAIYLKVRPVRLKEAISRLTYVEE
jgi:integrase